MRRTLLRSVALVVSVCVPAPAGAQETVENPEYKKWAVWKEGAYATLKGENRFGDTLTVVTSTQTLKKLSADKAVIEVTTVTETGGQTIKAPPTTMEIAAREPKLPPEVQRQLEEQIKKLEGKQTKGKETLTINGKKLACEWVRHESEGNDSKCWTCADVPNEVVKLESAIGPLKSNMQLIDWKGTKK